MIQVIRWSQEKQATSYSSSNELPSSRHSSRHSNQVKHSLNQIFFIQI